MSGYLKLSSKQAIKMTKEELKEKIRKYDRTIFFVVYDYMTEPHYFFIKGSSIYLIWAGVDLFQDLAIANTGLDRQKEIIKLLGAAESINTKPVIPGIFELKILDPKVGLTHMGASVRKAAKYCLGEEPNA